MKKLCNAQNSAEAQMIVDILDENGIKAEIKGAFDPLLPSTIWIENISDFDKAISIIKEIKDTTTKYEHTTNVSNTKKSRFWLGLIIGFFIGTTIFYFIEDKGIITGKSSSAEPNEWDSNNDGNVDIWREVKEDDKYVEIYDVNFDGKQDDWFYHNKEGVLERSEKDSNFDGKIDHWTSFNKQGVLKHDESDTNFDGKIDYWASYNKQGILEHDESDSDFDGKIDYWGKCKDGYIIEATFDHNGDGEKDEWCTYQNFLVDECKWSYSNDTIIDKKVIYKNGKKIKELYDRNRDGTFDQTIVLDEFERVIEDKKTDLYS